MSRLIHRFDPPAERLTPSALRTRDTANVLLALSDELHRRIVHRAGARSRVVCTTCGCLCLRGERCPGCRAATRRRVA